MYFNLFISRTFSNLIQTHFSPSLNSRIKALVQQGHYIQALETYTREPHFPININNFTFPPLLKACSFLSNLHYGKTIHANIITMGLQFDQFITSSLINMYRKCGSFSNAVQLFENLSEIEVLSRDVTVWNSMIDGYFKYGFIKEGLAQFRRMQNLGVKPDGYSLSILLRACEGYLEGKQILCYAVKNMFLDDPFVMTALIDLYSSCCRPVSAWNVFEVLGDKENVAAWNAMIRGFYENGFWENSLEFYILVKNESCKPVSATLSSTLVACSQGDVINFGKQIHGDVIKMGFHGDPYVSTSLLTMYAKCGLPKDAENVFDSVQDKVVELWNAMISAYVGNGYTHKALDVYIRMRFESIQSDPFTISNLFASCSLFGLYDFGRALHGEVIKRPIQSNMPVQTALLTMYSKCGKMEDANGVFDTITEKDVVSWGSLISGFCLNKKFEETLYFFRAMVAENVKPDSDIMVSVINTCAGLGQTELGFGVHGFVIKSGLHWDAFVASSLIDMYSKYRIPEMAMDISRDMPDKNLEVWNSLISCYSQNGLPEKSIGLLSQLVQHGLSADSVSIIIFLSAVSSMAALLKGKTIHGYSFRLGIPFDVQVENALIDMYIKCGCLKYAQNIFQNMSSRNLVTWNSIISGYGSHGECFKAISLFKEMRQSGIKPDEITFLSMISSCNHSGLIDEGMDLFHMMRGHSIKPRMEHYVNIVDLLGRAGFLEDAYTFIQKMPMDPDRSIWLTLLSACRVYQNIELGEIVGHNLLKIDPDRGSNYVQLLNLYVEAGLKDKAGNLRALMRQKELKKKPGCSWIEVREKVDVFFSWDSSSPRTVEIYETLGCLSSNMQQKGGYHELIEAF